MNLLQTFLSIILMMSVAHAGTISEISVYLHRQSQKKVVFFAEQHFGTQLIEQEQKKQVVQLLNKLSKVKNKISFLMEDRYSSLLKEIRERQFSYQVGPFSVFSEIADAHDNGEGIVLSINDILNRFHNWLILAKNRERSSANFSREINATKKCLSEMANEIDLMLAEFKISEIMSKSIEEIKALPLGDIAAKNGDLFQDVLDRVEEIYIALRAENEEDLDSFDWETLNAVIEAPNETIFMHVAGSAHKNRVSKLLVSEGFEPVLLFFSETRNQALESLNKILLDKIEQQFGKSPNASELFQVAAFIKEQTEILSARFSPLISVQGQAFFAVEQYLTLES